MSYILDALKKLEKERQQRKPPDLLSIQDRALKEPRKRHIWPYAVIAVLLLNTVIIILWLNPLPLKKSDIRIHVDQVQQKTSEVKQASSSESTSFDKSRTKKKETLPVNENIVLGSATKHSVAGRQEKIIKEEPYQDRKMESGQEVSDNELPVKNKIYRVHELPSSIQKNLPKFNISIALYSDDQASRMVKVNDETLREGEYLTAGLKLEEITQKGIIFNYQNYRFRVEIR